MADRAKVLIVDDERNMRATLSEILREEGYAVSTADSGEAAVDLCGRESFDVVLMDVRMPGMNGVEAFRNIHRHCSSARVILMSAYTVDELKKVALAEGAVAFLKKPLNIEAVIKLIADVNDTAILLVDTDRATLELVQTALKGRGYRVTVASTAREALKLTEQIRFDVVITEIALPAMNGLELHHAISKISPPRLAVMIAGADDVSQNIAREARRHPGVSVIGKPLDINDVLTLVQTVRDQQISGDARRPSPATA